MRRICVTLAITAPDDLRIAGQLPAARVAQLLAASGIGKPDARAMQVMELRFTTKMNTVSTPAAALELYELCKALPGSSTIAAADAALGITIDGPLYQDARALLFATHRSGTRALLMRQLHVSLWSDVCQLTPAHWSQELRCW